eukprot:TRINITY_DN9049_c0_g2_i1.p1 TRINITY_DN9049_c0_g2~~TRINITY_DN9049_c0_g2_i1.p1  ORF type:complete len:245 (+),score=53.69 TRINITY_DN9049_c0_g2_i1:172-906(+)
MTALSFAFGGCSHLNMPYQIGAARFIKETLPRSQFSKVRYVGTANGAFPAALIAGDLGLQRARSCLATIRKNRSGRVSMIDNLLEMLPEDAHQRVQGNLAIARRSNFGDLFDHSEKAVEIETEFSTLDQLKNVIRRSISAPDVIEMLSCAIPFFGGSRPIQLHQAVPKLDAKSITISPYPFAGDVCPKVSLSSNLALAPSMQDMKMMEDMGYRDCKSFLSKHRDVLVAKMEATLPSLGMSSLAR